MKFTYVRGLGEKLERACRDISVRLVFSSKRTLRSLLLNVKSKRNMDKVKGVVYKIDCECGHTYIGETGRTMEVRMKEHKWAVRYDDVNNGIAVHANRTRHSIQWESAQVVEVEQNWSKRRIKEALHIRDLKNTMNLDNGLQICSIWNTLHPLPSLPVQLP